MLTTQRRDLTLSTYCRLIARMSAKLKTSSDVIDALGGLTAVARLTGASSGAVWNWRQRGFPSQTFLILTAALTARGLKAPASLWRMREAAE